jgi:hypothetical protein
MKERLPLVPLWFAAAFFGALSLHAQSAPEEPPRFPQIRFGGFADAIFAGSTHRQELESVEADLYGLVLLSDRWSAVGEGLVKHVSRSAGEEASRGVEFNLERLYLALEPSDRFRLEIGQIHTGIIHWNEREHRGRFLQTPIDVPTIANREEQGGAWPLHCVGFWAYGRLPGSLGLQYGAGIGEARGPTVGEIRPPTLDDVTSAGLLSLSISPDALTGFELGGAAYLGRIPAPDGELRERDITLFTSFVRGPIELRGEWAQMRHERIKGNDHFATRGWYALGSWRPHGRWQVLRPYVLIDHLTAASGELYLRDVHDQNAWAAGLRWDAMKWLAAKSDYRQQLAPNGGREHVIRLQIAVSF